MTNAVQEARTIFLAHDGILRGSEAQKFGIHRQTLARMLESEILVKEERGLYRLAGSQPGTHLDLIQVAKLVPKAVICLISALNFHGLTTQIPRKVYIALPAKTKKPKISYPPIDLVWLSPRPYSSGIERHRMGSTEVTIYGMEKTVADIFKFRSKIGEDIAIEALRDYMKKDGHDLNRLLHFAEIDRVKTVMTPYIRSLL